MSSIPFIPLLSNSSWYDFNSAQAEAVSILGFWKFLQAFGTGTFWCPVGTWKMKLILVCVKSTTTYRIFKVLMMKFDMRSKDLKSPIGEESEEA
ncbi:hypothetical protein H0E87_022124 [Populus deltoides]|uniref:Uncharacterized protein n=1 Tax=Populus deltoides TaxID=3696 RepID=A0A8T2XK69_POPDE|nr:hypothetical protein H0E87_022124 [Populus deltoides]